jgi:hypothetical protein
MKGYFLPNAAENQCRLGFFAQAIRRRPFVIPASANISK